jgi:hypothetical protein
LLEKRYADDKWSVTVMAQLSIEELTLWVIQKQTHTQDD